MMVMGVSSTVLAGNSPPSTTGSLPYYTSRPTMSSYAYTNTQWAPSSSGEIYVAVSYKTTNGENANFYNRLYWGSEQKVSHKVATGSSANKAATRFYNLSTDKVYSVKFTTNNKLTFKAGCGKTLATAKNYTF